MKLIKVEHKHYFVENPFLLNYFSYEDIKKVVKKYTFSLHLLIVFTIFFCAIYFKAGTESYVKIIFWIVRCQS